MASILFFALDAVILIALYVFGVASGVLFFADGLDALQADSLNPVSLFVMAAVANLIMRYYAAIDSYRTTAAQARQESKRLSDSITASVGDAQRLANKASGM